MHSDSNDSSTTLNKSENAIKSGKTSAIIYLATFVMFISILITVYGLYRYILEEIKFDDLAVMISAPLLLMVLFVPILQAEFSSRFSREPVLQWAELEN
jgi:hypothetical protein